MPTNNSELFNRFKVTIQNLINQLKNDLPNFDVAEFRQVFGKTLEDNLSSHGKSIYATGLDPDVLTGIHLDVSEKLNQDYQEILADAATELQVSFDPTAIVNNAKQQLKIKLEVSKKLLLEKLNAELATKDQEFTNPADKKELNTAFINYLNQIGKKYETSLGRIESIGSQLAKLQLHLSNEKTEFKIKNLDSSFAVNEIDLGKLSIGAAPAPVTGFRVHKDNLSEQIMHALANKKDGEKINIELTVPDRAAIFRKIGAIGLQYRNPAVALIIMLFFYLAAMLFNNDEKRAVTAIKKVIEEKGIIMNPNDFTISIKHPNEENGKPTFIRQKAALNAESIKELQLSIDENKKKLQEHSHSQIKNKNPLSSNPVVGSGHNSETEEEEGAYSRPRGP